ncbi:MAG: hypothetical protein KC766_40405, partial [Myxococcales bacterium]|nr:hypothetical protein [Myxococcales bacterium]
PALSSLGERDVEAVVALWVRADGVEELPPELGERLCAVRVPAGETPARLRLRKLLVCFEHWPPIRGEVVAPKALEGVTSTSPTVEFESRAGGLLFWSALLEATDVFTQLASACPHPRTLSSVLWALARSLESPALDPRDPLLLRFCGELPSARVSPGQVLQGAEPEPVHRLALQLAKLEEPDLQLTRWGDGWLATTNTLVVDSALEGDPEEALPAVVQRFRERTGDAPQSVELLGTPAESARVSMELLDSPSLPDPWRPAMLALASVMRQQLVASYGVDLEGLRGWKARLVVSGGNAMLGIQGRDVRRVGSGSWVAESVSRFGLGEGLMVRWEGDGSRR